jgi:hypothetical protein
MQGGRQVPKNIEEPRDLAETKMRQQGLSSWPVPGDSRTQQRHNCRVYLTKRSLQDRP